MKLLFIQLPLIDHGYNYIGGNVPYASATLTAYINNNYKEHHAEYLPYILTNFTSDNVIIKYILNSGYDTVCFCNYLWNIERHLKLGKNLKKADKNITLIFGGPEICIDSFALKSRKSYVDIFFSGEGEWFFREYFSNRHAEFIVPAGANYLIVQPRKEDIAVDEICEPFVHNYLNDMPDGSVFIELTRGCPFRCSYCFYSKNSQKIRETEFENIINIIKHKKSIKEIYILSPTFNGNNKFGDRLDQLIKLKHDVRLHTELKAEGIDFKTAQKIYRAGFKSLEIGIQTLNKKALKTAGRRADTESEIIGLQNLQKAGIELKIGIIPGMPEDTPDDFRKTIDTLISKGLGDALEFYPLMILPGTRIREQIEKYEIKYQDKPPYFIKSSRDFSMDDILDLKEYLEDATELYATISKNPDLTGSSESAFCKGIALSFEEMADFSAEKLDEIINTNVFSFIIEVSEKINYHKIRDFFTLLKNREELFNVIFRCQIEMDDDEIYDILKFVQKDNLFRRIHLYDEWKAGNSIMVYQFIEDFSKFKRINSEYYYIEPVLKVTPRNVTLLKKEIKSFDEVPVIFVTSSVFPELLSFIILHYTEYYDKISFESKDDYRIFIEKSKGDYIDFPFEFCIKNN